MTDSKQKPPQRDPVGATVDSVVGAIGMLWDWFGAPPKANAPEPSVVDLFLGTGEVSAPELRCGRCDNPIGSAGVCYCVNGNVIDTEGEDV